MVSHSDATAFVLISISKRLPLWESSYFLSQPSARPIERIGAFQPPTSKHRSQARHFYGSLNTLYWAPKLSEREIRDWRATRTPTHNLHQNERPPSQSVQRPRPCAPCPAPQAHPQDTSTSWPILPTSYKASIVESLMGADFTPASDFSGFAERVMSILSHSR